MRSKNRRVALCIAGLMSVAKPGVAQDWSGPYAGVFAGYSDFDFDAVYLGPAIGSPLPFDQTLGDYALGGYLGYNFQRGDYVYGPEIDIGWLPGAEGVAEPGGAAGIEVSVTGHVRGRFGVLTGNDWLVYGAAGLAIADVDVNRVPAAGTPTFQNSETMVGLSLGIGAERAIGDRAYLRVEYIYDHYFDEGIADTQLNGATPFFPEIETDAENHTLRVGITFALD